MAETQTTKSPVALYRLFSADAARHGHAKTYTVPGCVLGKVDDQTEWPCVQCAQANNAIRMP